MTVVSILAANALTLYETVKAELNAASSGVAIVDATHQNLIERRINAVSSAVEAYLQRTLRRMRATEVYAPPRGPLVPLNRWPISTLEADAPVCTLDGSVVAASVDGAASDEERRYLLREGGWGGEAWEDAVAGAVTLATVPGSAERCLSIAYTAGYVTPSQAADDEATGAALDTRVGTGAGAITGVAGAGATGALVITVDTGGSPYDIDFVWNGGTPYRVIGISAATMAAGIDLATVDSDLAGLTWTLTSPMGVTSMVESWDVTPTVYSTRTLPTQIEEAVIESVCASWRLRQSGFAADGADTTRVGILTDDALSMLDPFRRLS